METKNKEVRFVLEQVIGDYLAVLHEADDIFSKEEYNLFVDGLYEIGKVFDINIHEYDKGMTYPLLPSPKTSIPDIVDVVTEHLLERPKSEARRVDKPPYVCTKCGSNLRLVYSEKLIYWSHVVPETGKLEGQTVLEDGRDMEEFDFLSLECGNCQEIFNFHHDNEGNILSFNDDLF